jgi:hypothetical protein
MRRLFQAHPASSEPRWGSGAYWMSLTQGSRCASTLGYGRFPLQGMAGADGCASWSCGDFRLDEQGVSDPGGLAAHGNGFCPIQVQRSGHGGPPPRHASFGPFRRDVWMGVDWAFPIQGFLLPNWSGACGSASSGADTEIRPPATRDLGPEDGLPLWDADWGFRSKVLGGPLVRFSPDPGPAGGHGGPRSRGAISGADGPLAFEAG